MIKRIAILTGDDDAPGMNAVIHSVTKTALRHGWEVIGICDGYLGLLSGDYIPLSVRTVEGIIQRGGTMLGSMDSGSFSTESRQKLAVDSLTERGIDALIVIGNQDSLTGAAALAKLGFLVNGVAASIENDLVGFDPTLGTDTAINIALNTIDHLQPLPATGTCPIIIEVAGHKCGYLALVSALTSGAEAVIIPEIVTTPAQIEELINHLRNYPVIQPVIVVAEGAAYEVNRLLRRSVYAASPDRGIKQIRLGYLQRRAAPSAYDRLLGLRLGTCAVEALVQGEYGIVAGSFHEQTRTLPLAEIVGKTKLLDPDLLRLATDFEISMPAPLLADAPRA